MAIGSKRLYVGSSDGLRILDLGVPNQPKEIGFYRTNEYIPWVAVENGIACVVVVRHHSRLFRLGAMLLRSPRADEVSSQELIVLNVTDAAAPRVLETAAVAKNVDNFAFKNGCVYACDRDGKVVVYDVKKCWDSQSKPAPITSSGPVDNNTLIAVCRGGIRIYSLKDPATPVLAGSYEVKEE